MLLVANPIAFGILLVVLGLSVYTDLRAHRIPNVLSFGSAFAGLTLQAFYFGFDGLLAGAGGLAAGLAIFLPFYIAKGMSAGDVKLMGAVGTFLGPMHTLLASGLTLMAGFFLAILVIVTRGELVATAQRYWLVACNFAVNRNLKGSYLPPEAGGVGSTPFPYAAAIAGGTGLALWWLGVAAPLSRLLAIEF